VEKGKGKGKGKGSANKPSLYRMEVGGGVQLLNMRCGEQRDHSCGMPQTSKMQMPCRTWCKPHPDHRNSGCGGDPADPGNAECFFLSAAA
jgi:hypothetical protein